MPSWKKVITSGSSPVFNQITASGNISSSNNLIAKGWYGENGDNYILSGLPNLAIGDSDIFFNTEQSYVFSYDTAESMEVFAKQKKLSLGNIASLNRQPQKSTFHLVGDMTTTSHITASGTISASLGISQFDKILTSGLRFKRPGTGAISVMTSTHGDRSNDIVFKIPGDISASGDFFLSESVSFATTNDIDIYGNGRDLDFRAGGTTGVRFTINGANSNVAIGTTKDTSHELTVEGDITASGTTYLNTLELTNITASSDIYAQNVYVPDGGDVGAVGIRWVFNDTDNYIKPNAVTHNIVLGDDDRVDDVYGVLIEKLDNNTTKPFLLIVNDDDAADRAYITTRTDRGGSGEDRAWSFGTKYSSDAFMISSGSGHGGNIAGSETFFNLQSNNDGTAYCGINTLLKTPPQALTVGGGISASGDFFLGNNTPGHFISASNGNMELSGSGTAVLEVVGDISASQKLYVNEITASAGISASGDITATGDIYVSNIILPDDGVVGATNEKWVFNESDNIINTFNANTKVICKGSSTDYATYEDYLDGGGIGAFTNYLNGTNPQMLSVNTRDATGAHAYNQIRTGKDDRMYNYGIHASSGDFFIASGSITRTHFVIQDATANVGIGTASPGEKLEVVGNISASGLIHAGAVSASGNLRIGNPPTNAVGKFNVNHGHPTGSSIQSALGKGTGEIIQMGGVTTTAGLIYVLSEDSTAWTLPDIDTESKITGLLAVALGTNSTTDGMLIRGMAQVSQSGRIPRGRPVYLRDGGIVTGSVQDYGDDDIVRVLGHCLDWGNSNGSASIYFNPDTTWVEVS
tara:strand:+ start:2243 stop:4669 length:2427 start_codon:yes stop_codon:yes gene_type:complete